jgi:WD40 repeat protein
MRTRNPEAIAGVMMIHTTHNQMKTITLLRAVGAASFLFVHEPVASLAQQPTLKASLVRTVSSRTGPGRQVAFSPNSQLLASSNADGTITLWSIADGKLARIIKHPLGVTSIAFSPDGASLASGGYDQEVRVWRVSDGALLKTLKGHNKTVWTVAFSPNGERLATAGEDSTVRLWNAKTGALTHTLKGHTRTVWSVAFSPDGQLLASGSFDKTIRIWRADNGALVRTLTGSGEAVVHVDFSPDGTLLASGGDDRLIRLWRVKDGSVAKTLTGSDHVYAVAFSRDGQWLASAGRGRGNVGTAWQYFFGNKLLGGNATTVRLWRVSDGALQDELAGHSDDVMSIALSGDGQWLASSGEEGKVNLWRLTKTPK